MTWDAVTAIASAVSMVAFVLSAIYVRAQLKELGKDRYLKITNDLFTTWQSREFMEAQLWLIHQLDAKTWKEFVKGHRGDSGELAFHQVGSFYDRVGTLVRLGFVDENEILATVGGHAIAVWRKIEPLVREAREVENSVLFGDFERIMPACHACYVPSLGASTRVAPFSLEQPVPRITREALQQRLDQKEAVTLLDVRQPSQLTGDRRTLPRAVVMPPDKVERRHAELPADREIVVYCACPNEETSGRVALWLRERGYQAYALTGGFDAWRDAGLPLDGV
ncbi:MAG: rhodanese-like domain-containing protein [Isosphaeraceae bacterium]|nr:rhodanese-like domain-containing protein [Isosphaeraceae bacterium]